MRVKVVTVFLRRGGRILILKRSRKVGSYAGRWAGISGFIEENETPIDAARREVYEETGIRKADKEKNETFKWIAPEEVIK